MRRSKGLFLLFVMAFFVSACVESKSGGEDEADSTLDLSNDALLEDQSIAELDLVSDADLESDLTDFSTDALDQDSSDGQLELTDQSDQSDASDFVEPVRPAACDLSAIYVSAMRGNANNNGAEATPLATLEQASLLARERQGHQSICVEAGRYPLQATWTLEAVDSDVSYYALGGRVQLTGGVELDLSGFAPLNSDDPAFLRVPESARPHVWVAHLPSLGLEDFGVLRRRGFGASGNASALELRVDGELFELARWPNADVTNTWNPTDDAVVSGDLFGQERVFTYLGTTAVDNADDGFPNYMTEVDGENWYLYHCSWTWEDTTPRYWVVSQVDPRVSASCWPTTVTSWVGAGNTPNVIPALNPLGTNADLRESLIARNSPPDMATEGLVRTGDVLTSTQFNFPGDRWQAWSQAPELWVNGLFANYWASNALPASITDGVVTLGEEASYGVNPSMPFYVFNLLEELDIPGEFYLERQSGRLYLWPGQTPSRIEASVMEQPLLQLNQVTDLRFEGFDFDMARSTLIEGDGLERVVFADCSIADSGGNGASIEGRESGFEYSTFANLGGVGVSLRGGARESLTPGNNFVRDSVAYNFGRWGWTYHPAVSLAGCGNTIEHNHFYQAPHSAILFSGNEHHIAYNEIDHVVLKSNDAGAIYVGRDWGYRGNILEHNHIHHIESIFGSSHGIYLDDSVSGMTLRYNLIHDINGHTTMAGGGRDHTIVSNILVEAEGGAHFCDRRAVVKAAEGEGSWDFLDRLQAIFESYRHGTPLNHQAEPWLSAYPRLAQVPNDWSQLNGSHWLEPEGNVFTNNLYWNTSTMIVDGSWGGSGCASHYTDTQGNLEADPLFVGGDDYHLQPNSPAYSMPGFTVIDLDAVGPR